MAYKIYTQENFYSQADIDAAEKVWPQGEVDAAFRKYRDAVDVGDHETMASMLSDDGRGGNATFGLFHDRVSYKGFLTSFWQEIIPNHSVWIATDKGRVLNRWCEVLPGTPPEGDRYDYFGINEVIYNGNGQFRLMFSTPDLFGLQVLYKKWVADAQVEKYGDIYPGLA
ncbi:MAG: hypothetical protein V7746_20330 [Halioglobus sp.]